MLRIEEAESRADRAQCGNGVSLRAEIEEVSANSEFQQKYAIDQRGHPAYRQGNSVPITSARERRREIAEVSALLREAPIEVEHQR